MGKKSKKRKSKKSPSPFQRRHEGYKDQDSTKSSKSSTKEQDVSNQKRYTAKGDKFASPAFEDVSQSSRQIKKPVYRLTKPQAADPNSLSKEDGCTKSKRSSFQVPKGNCSNKEERETSERHSLHESRHVGKRSPKHSKPSSRVREKSKGSSSEKTPHGNSLSSKCQGSTATLVLDEQKDRSANAHKRKIEVENDTDRDHKEFKTRESCKTSSVSKHLLKQKEKELVEKLRTRLENTEFKAKRKFYKDEAPALAKDSTSGSSSNASNSIRTSSKNVNSMSDRTSNSLSSRQPECPSSSSLPPNYKIPKVVQSTVADCATGNKSAASTHLKQRKEPSNLGASVSSSITLKEAHRCSDATPGHVSDRKERKSSSPDQLPSASHSATDLWCDEMQVVEELHLARSEKRLEVDVLHSCGELTCMDIDPPEEDSQPIQQDLVIVLDTNILLSHLDYVKRMISHGLGGKGFPVVLIPWVVLQELDSLKKGKGLSVSSVAHLAIPAISYILNSLKGREPRLWGQSMQQASQSNIGLNAENNDDRVLQCCLQYQRLYPECAVILCTNDKNLCSKALVSGVAASSKRELEAEVGRCRRAFPPLQDIKTPAPPPVSSPMLSTDYTSVQPQSHQRAGLSLGRIKEDSKPERKKVNQEQPELDLSTHVHELEDCLQEVLSDVLKVEMKAAFDDLWLEIVYIKPPWNLRDVLQCLKKHWAAVFGHVVPRRKLQTVLNLIDFFKSGKSVDRISTLAALQDAKEIVKAFWKTSGCVPSALAVLDGISKKLQPQDESPAADVVMTDDDKEVKQPTQCSVQASQQEVWALFENIWSSVWQTSMDGFKALGFDPHTMKSSQPAGGPPPSQDALLCLHKLSSMVSQLLQAFSSILSSECSLEEYQSLLSVLHSYEIVNVDSRLTAKDLRDCFSQQDYREKLQVGGNQLVELKGTLDHCIGVTVGQQQNPFPT